MQQFELLKGKASDAAVGGMFDFALLAKGGTDKADRSPAVALDFEVKRKSFAFNGHQISIISRRNQVNIAYRMATNEIRNGCGLSTRAFLDIDEIEHLLRRVTQLGSQMRSSALRFGIKVPFSGRCWRLSFVGPASKISPSFGEFRSWLGSGATVQASAPFWLSTSKQTGRPKTSIGSFPSGCPPGIWLIRQ